MGSLPLPPNVPGPSQGQPAQMLGGQGPYTLPYQQPVASSLVQGIGEFMKQYQGARDQEKQRAAQQADQDIKNIMLGLPVDLKKTAASLKKAGVNLDFESTAPQVNPAQQSVAGTMAPSGMPSTIGDTGVPTFSGETPGPPIPAQPAPPQGRMDRFLQATGFKQPTINPQSPGMAALQQLQQRGGMQQQIQMQQMQNQQQLQTILTSALRNDPKAVELATRFGLAQSIPGDEWMRIGRMAGMSDEQSAKQQLYIAMGGPAMRKELISIADKNKDQFGGKMDQSLQYYNDILTDGRSSLQPSRTFDQQVKVVEQANKLLDIYPTMPLNVARTTAEVEASGNTDLADKMHTFIAKNFPSKGRIDLNKFGMDYNLQVQKFQQAMAQFKLSHELAVMNSVRESLGGQFNKFADLYNSKNADEKTKNAALQGMADAMQKLGSISVTLPGGQKMSLGTKNIGIERLEGWMHPSTYFNDWGGSPTLSLKMEDMLGPGNQQPGAISSAMEALKRIGDIPLYITDTKERQAYRTAQQKRLQEILGASGGGMMP